MTSDCLTPTASPPHGTAALEVASSSALFPMICSFLRGVPVWTVEYEYAHSSDASSSSRDDCAKRSMGTPGLLPRLAIERGDLRTLERLHKLHTQPQFLRKGKFWFTNAMADAAECGALDALQWLHENTSGKCPRTAMTLAAKNGHTDVLCWLLKHRPEACDMSSALDLAATNGHLDILKMLHTKESTCCRRDIMDQVAANGHLEVLQFLHENGHKGYSTAAADLAATNGHVTVVQWLLETQKKGISETASYGAVVNGHLDILRYLCKTAPSTKHRQEMVQRGMRHAVAHALIRGQVELVAFLHEQVPDAFPLSAMDQAASHGRLDIVKFLHGTGRPRDEVERALKVAEQLSDETRAEFLNSLDLKPPSESNASIAVACHGGA